MSRDAIWRDLACAAARDYDLIVIGGGIQGIMLALEAVRRRLRPLLLERGDFAGATSHNSLRILHGGLRYLQTLDLRRSLESIRERGWWLRRFPDLVAPLPCLMPLYGDGLRRPAALRPALALDNALNRLQGAERGRAAGRVINARMVAELFPGVDARGLQGGAVWHDAFVPEASRLCIEALRWACAEGAVALNYVEVSEVIRAGRRAAGVRARDLESGVALEFRADVVVNAAGASAPRLAAASGADAPGLFDPILAWNVAFARPPPSNHAVAVRPRTGTGRAHFLVPWKGVLLAGTGYARIDAHEGHLPARHLAAFIAELNAAVPGLGLRESEVLRIFSGVLPAAGPVRTEPAERAAILDHGTRGGPEGFFSLRTIKLTTARALADRVLRRAFPRARARAGRGVPGSTPREWAAWLPALVVAAVGRSQLAGPAPGCGRRRSGAPPGRPPAAPLQYRRRSAAGARACTHRLQPVPLGTGPRGAGDGAAPRLPGAASAGGGPGPP